MKKLFIALVMVLCLTTISHAAEITALVCDPVDGVVAAEVEVTKGTEVTITTTAPVIVGADMVLLDISTFTPGRHTFRARFIGEGGWPTDWSDPLVAG